MRIERDPLWHTLDPKPSIDQPQRLGEALQVLLHRRRADVDVHRRMPGVVKPCRDPTDHHELHPVIDEYPAEGCDPVIVDLAISHGY